MNRLHSNIILAAITGLTITACSSNNNTAADHTAADTVQTKAPYFPVTNYIRSEIALVDSTPVGIMKYTSSLNHSDSGYIRPEEFHRLANEFLSAEIGDSSFAKQYTESAFLDKTTGNATFYYSADNSAASIKRVDIVTARGDVYDNVKSIYIEKHITQGDTPVVKKLFWKPQRNFQIITQYTDEKGDVSTQLTKVVWDNRE